MTLANKITLLRILFVPLIVIGLLEDYTTLVYILLGICMVSDFLDGLVARRLKQRTNLGAFLDPMADKLLLISVFMTLAYLHRVPMWIFVVIFSRDLLIVLGWSVIHILTGSSTIEPRWLGKTTTAFQMISALAAIMDAPFILERVLFWCAVLLTAASAIDYIIVGEKKLGAWH